MSNVRAGTAELAETLDNVRQGMDILHKHTITETVFKNTLLQLALAFHAGESIDPSTGKPIDLGNWVVKAGNIYNGVTVIDDNTKEVLYQTPGIFTSCSLTIANGLHKIIDDASYNNSLMLSTDRIYQEGLSKGSVLEMDNGAKHILGWYDIFVRYGYKMVIIGEPEEAISTPVEEDWGDGELA